MNHAVADINSAPVRWKQFDSDQPDAEEIEEARNAEYLDNWMRGTLYDDGRTYRGPHQMLIDNEPDLLADMLTDYTSGDPDELNASAGRVCRALIAHVYAQT